MQQFSSTPSMLSFPNRLPLEWIWNPWRTGRKLRWRKEFDQVFFRDLGKHFRLLLQLHGSLPPLRLLFQLLVLWIKLLQKLSGRSHSPHSSSTSSPRRAGGPGSARIHDDSRILYGHPIDDGDDEPSRNGAEASAWDSSHSKAPSDFSKEKSTFAPFCDQSG